ncbi:MAG TPA: FAD:protein FMN transferase [Dehalococcoidia bacterium]|nr:FAD:protein FMN transferase [Dehalococcoidia bacterium]
MNTDSAGAADDPANESALDSLRVVFRAMGTEVSLAVWPRRGQEASAEAALWAEVALLREADALLSRFLPESEISRLNRGAVTPVRVSALTFSAIEIALDAAAASGGLFDPTVYGALLAAGYDRSFADLEQKPSRSMPAAALPRQAGRWREVLLDEARGTVTLPNGVGLDLGGIAKGWLADRVAERLGVFGPALVDIGGDIAMLGLPPDAPAWAIDVDGPFGAVLGTLQLEGGRGVATSGITRRRWQTEAGSRHHLIDPRTGAPALTDLLSVTVVAPTTAAAEVAAKGALLLGSVLGLAALVQAAELGGLLVRRDGRVLVAGSLSWIPAGAAQQPAEVNA